MGWADYSARTLLLHRPSDIINLCTVPNGLKDNFSQPHALSPCLMSNTLCRISYAASTFHRISSTILSRSKLASSFMILVEINTRYVLKFHYNNSFSADCHSICIQFLERIPCWSSLQKTALVFLCLPKLSFSKCEYQSCCNCSFSSFSLLIAPSHTRTKYKMATIA